MENSARIKAVSDIKRVVIKVGSSSITYSNGLLNLNQIDKIVRQVADAHNRGIEVIIVSSGAIAAGVGKLKFSKKPDTIPKKQAAAAVGQGILLQMYEKIFSEYGKIVAQILITKEDMEDKQRNFNAKNAFKALLNMGVIPVVNENDAVATDEIKFGDNDTLSSVVASLVKADLLILLSDIDGLYDCNPREFKDAKIIKDVFGITKDIEECAGKEGTSRGTGGMITKIRAAKIALASGCNMAIVNSSVPGSIISLLDGKDIGTFFYKGEV